MSENLKPEHIETATKFVERVHATGPAPVDLDRFWQENEISCNDPWSPDCPQMPLGIGMSRECMFEELGIEMDWHRLLHDSEWRAGHAKRYNDLAQEIVGRRLLNEKTPDDGPQMPYPKALHDIFEAKNEWNVESYWLHQAATNEDELAQLLDRVEARLENLRDFMLPDDWDEKKKLALAADKSVPLYRGQRGPITFAMSIYGVEELIYLIMDNPDLARRFSDLILRAMLERARILDEEAGYTPETAPHGFYWCDDNCAMLNADMYEFFGYPILKGIFDRYSPDPADRRGQHSDSAMSQLLPLLGKLDLNTVNFGPTLTVTEIREHLPNAVIHGQLAPFTFSRNEEVNIVAELLRDMEMARESRGVVFATAGSINHGSRLSGLRLIMSAIQEFCRY